MDSIWRLSAVRRMRSLSNHTSNSPRKCYTANMSESPHTPFIINTGTIVRFFLIAILIVALYYISDVLLVVVAAVVIASAIEPVIRRMQRRKIHRVLGVVFVYICIALVIAGLLIFFVPMVVSDSVSFLSN